MSFAGGITFGVVLLISMMPLQALAYGAFRQTDPGVVRALFDFAYTAGSAYSLWLALFLAPASIVVLRSNVLPRWLGYLGLAFSALGLLGPTSLFAKTGALAPGEALPVLMVLPTLLWVVATSLLLLGSRAIETKPRLQ